MIFLPSLDFWLQEGRHPSCCFPHLCIPSAQNDSCSQEHSGNEHMGHCRHIYLLDLTLCPGMKPSLSKKHVLTLWGVSIYGNIPGAPPLPGQCLQGPPRFAPLLPLVRSKGDDSFSEIPNKSCAVSSTVVLQPIGSMSEPPPPQWSPKPLHTSLPGSSSPLSFAGLFFAGFAMSTRQRTEVSVSPREGEGTCVPIRLFALRGHRRLPVRLQPLQYSANEEPEEGLASVVLSQ